MSVGSFCYISLFSLGGDDEAKIDDMQSMGSGAGEYEPISDDELDEILAGDAEKREDQQDDEKMPGENDESHFFRTV